MDKTTLAGKKRKDISSWEPNAEMSMADVKGSEENLTAVRGAC